MSSSFEVEKKILLRSFESNKIDEDTYLQRSLDILRREEEEAKSERDLKLREIDLEIIREQNKIPRLSSPHKIGTVHILCDDSKTPVGTCFSVQDKDHNNNLVLTACHNLRDHMKKGDKYYLAEKLIRSLTGMVTSVPTKLIEVELVEWDVDLDWAVLKRCDSSPFELTLEIKPSQCKVEDKLKTYHCPVSFFTQKDSSVWQFLTVHVTSWNKVCVVNDHLLVVETGLVKGSSGGPIIDEDGKVVAIYMNSLSAFDPNSTAKEIALGVINNPLTMKEGRIIAFTSKLRDYFF